VQVKWSVLLPFTHDNLNRCEVKAHSVLLSMCICGLWTRICCYNLYH